MYFVFLTLIGQAFARVGVTGYSVGAMPTTFSVPVREGGHIVLTIGEAKFVLGIHSNNVLLTSITDNSLQYKPDSCIPLKNVPESGFVLKGDSCVLGSTGKVVIGGLEVTFNFTSLAPFLLKELSQTVHNAAYNEAQILHDRILGKKVAAKKPDGMKALNAGTSNKPNKPATKQPANVQLPDSLIAEETDVLENTEKPAIDILTLLFIIGVIAAGYHFYSTNQAPSPAA